MLGIAPGIRPSASPGGTCVQLMDDISSSPHAQCPMFVSATVLQSRRTKQSRHSCEAKFVTQPLTTTTGMPEPSKGARFQGLRSKGVTSQSVPTQRSEVVTLFLMA